MISSAKKIIGVEALKKKLSVLRKSGKTIAFTNGCFDLMHMGHVSYLQAAKKGNRVLIVGLNSDKSISRIKGPSRPICPQKSRAAVLAALECVDYVVVFNEDTPSNLIKAVKPDVLVKGADYTIDRVVGADFVKAHGGRVVLVDLVPGQSTTGVIQRMDGAKGR